MPSLFYLTNASNFNSIYIVANNSDEAKDIYESQCLSNKELIESLNFYGTNIVFCDLVKEQVNAIESLWRKSLLLKAKTRADMSNSLFYVRRSIWKVGCSIKSYAKNYVRIVTR